MRAFGSAQLVQIVLVLVFLAALAVAGLIGVLATSLVLGGLVSLSPRTRVAAPFFVVALPMGIVGALIGGAGIGALATQHNGSLIVFGPLAGIAIGGLTGLALGTLATHLGRRMFAARESVR